MPCLPYITLRWMGLAAGIALVFADPAGAGHLVFISEFRELETPNEIACPSTSFGFYSESRSGGPFHVSQTSTFSTDRFVGNGSANAPPIIPDPVAMSRMGFEFSIAEMTLVRFEATAYSSGISPSNLGFRRIGPTTATLVDECAGWLCNLTAFFPETKTVASVFTLTPGTYSVGATSYTDARDFFSTPDECTWSVRLASPPSVPVSGWSIVGITASLLLGGLAHIPRRAFPSWRGLTTRAGRREVFSTSRNSNA